MLNEFQMSNTKFFDHLDFGIELTFEIWNLTLLTAHAVVCCGASKA
jgi:hypothetical protein